MDEMVFIAFHAPAEMRDALASAALADKRSLSNLLRLIVSEWLAERFPPPEKTP